MLKSEFDLNRSKLRRLDNLFKFPLDCEEQANELLRWFFQAICLENDLSKVDKILKLTFLKARNDFEGLKTAFRSIYCS